MYGFCVHLLIICALFAFLSLFLYRGNPQGHSIGNLFFSTWGGFLVSLLITADCFRSGAVQRALAAVGTVSAATAGHERIEMQQTGGDDDSDI